MTEHTTNAAEELAPCPFCGAKPHQGLTKAVPCQLHGDPIQRFEIWCPKGHARINEINRVQAITAWNTRPKETPTEQGEVARGKELDFALRSALRFAASRSAITAEQERRILASLSHPVSTNMQVAEAIVAAVVGSNADGCSSASAAYMKCCEAARNACSTITASSTTEGGGE